MDESHAVGMCQKRKQDAGCAMKDRLGSWPQVKYKEKNRAKD